MINIPVLRWGEPYDSLDQDEVVLPDGGVVAGVVGDTGQRVVGEQDRMVCGHKAGDYFDLFGGEYG